MSKTNFTQMTANVENISALDDLPNAAGMTAADLKATFDLGGKSLKEFINGTLLVELANEANGASGASKIGVQAIAALGNPTNVMDALGAILTVAQNAQAGTIIAGSIGTTELADDAVTAAKIDDGAVGRAALAASAVTPAKVDFTGDDLTIGANGKKLIINGPIVLSANSYGDSTPVSGDPGQLFFKKI